MDDSNQNLLSSTTSNSTESSKQSSRSSSSSSSSNVDRNNNSIEQEQQILSCYLIGIEIFNFKSYNGRHVVGPFTDLTAIIGPNGSGKSNLMDAISFALVTKSGKLRAENISKLINARRFSSKINEDGNNSAYVKLIFKLKENNQNFISIKRSIAVNSTSNYFVNECSVSKNDYLNYLIKLGFNPKNRIFLIFQGTIDTLITKNSKDFTNILEEISGSIEFKARYDQLKDQCIEKERELRVLISNKQSYLKSKNFVQFLGKQSEKSVELLSEVEEAKTKLILIDLYQNQNEIEKSRNEVKENVKIIEEIGNKAQHLQSKKTVLSKDVSKLESEKYKFQKSLRETEINFICKSKLNFQITNSKFIQAKNRLKNAVKNHEKVNAQFNSSVKLVDNLKQEIENVENEIIHVKNKIDRDSADMQVTQEDASEFNRLKELYHKSISEIEEGYANNEKHVSNLKLQYNFIDNQKTQLKNELDYVDSSLATKLTNVETEMENCHQELTKVSEERTNIESQLVDAKAKTVSLKEQLQSCKDEIKSNYFSVKNREVVEKEKFFLNYLVQTYPGVYGRLRDLCRPVHKKYHIAATKIMQKHLNAIVVDSYKTVVSLIKNENSKFISAETFLTLDKIKAPVIKQHLRSICAVQGVSLLYDMVHCKNSKIEKVIRFVIGNTLVCPNSKVANKVAFNLGDGKRYNAISLDGTYFQANGQISATFHERSPGNNWDYSNYNAEISKRNALDLSYLDACQQEALIANQLDSCNGKINSLNARLTMASQTKQSLEKKFSENVAKVESLAKEIKNLDAQCEELGRQIADNDNVSSEFKSKSAEIEKEIFQQFLSRLNFANVKQFETMFYSNFEDDIQHLNDCEKRLGNYQNKLELENGRKLQESVNMWQNLIEEENVRVEQIKDDLERYQKQYESDNIVYTDLQDKLNCCTEKLTVQRSELNSIENELSKAIETNETTNKATFILNSNLNRLYNSRHELFKKAYLEVITLPFNSDPDQYKHLFSNLSEYDNEDIYNIEDELIVDYSELAIQDIVNNSQDVVQTKYEIEKVLKEKEDEIQKLTLSDSSLTSKKKDLINNIRLVNNEIDNVRNELVKLKNEFQIVTKSRSEMFTSFLENVSVKLNIFYKELMCNQASQSFLIAENSEEPYLGGVMYNCILPGRMFQPISCLSGGEKTLAAFALIFSTYLDRLPSFFIMDEIDGPLDNVNISKLLNFVKSKMDQTQFILISHKIELFGQANSLVGVCKEKIDDQSFKSKTISFDLRKYD